MDKLSIELPAYPKVTANQLILAFLLQTLPFASFFASNTNFEAYEANNFQKLLLPCHCEQNKRSAVEKK